MLEERAATNVIISKGKVSIKFMEPTSLFYLKQNKLSAKWTRKLANRKTGKKATTAQRSTEEHLFLLFLGYKQQPTP